MDDSSLGEDVYDPAEIVTFPAEYVPKPGQDGMKIAWGTRAEIVVYCEGRDGRFPYPQTLYGPLHNDLQLDICRDMLQRFHSVFVNLQRSIKALNAEGFEGSEVRRRQEVHKASRDYFGHMVDATTLLESAVVRGGADIKGKVDLITERISELKRMLMVWHLAHLLFVVSVRGCSAQKYLREWIAFNTTVPETTPDNFWDVFFRLLIIGDVDGAVKEVQVRRQQIARTGKPAQELEVLASVLRSMPLFDENDSMVRRHEWMRWREDLQTKRAELISGGVPPDVFSILNGDEAALRKHARTWYEYGVGYIVFVNPLARAANLPEMVNDWIVAMSAEESDFDEVLAAIFEFDAAKLLSESMNCFKSTWFTAHLADILGHIGTFGINDKLRYGSDLREWFVLEYGSQLVKVGEGMWMMGSSYLRQCPVFGMRRLATTLSRVPFETAYEAERLIAVCNDYGLSEAAVRIRTVMGLKQWRRRRYCDAFLWFIQSGDAQRIHRAADKLVEICMTGTAEDRADVAATLAPFMDGSSYGARVDFLLLYHALQTKVDEGDWLSAAQILVRMVEKDIVPLQYRHRLLFNDEQERYDALSVLCAANDIVFGPEDTKTLLSYLESLRLSTGARLWESKAPVRADRVMQLRQALAQNLARALLAH